MTPSNRALVDLLVGRMHWNSNWDAAAPGSGPARYDTATLMYSGTSFFNDTSDSERQNLQFTGNFSYYKQNFLGGNHDLKVGFEGMGVTYSRSVGERESDGDYLLSFQRGAPFQIVTYSIPFKATSDMRSQSAFIKDTWAIGDRRPSTLA